MTKLQIKSPKGIALIAIAVVAVIGLAVACVLLAGGGEADINIHKVPATEQYGYVNPDETRAQTDAGMSIDGILDEDIYKDKNWLYLSNSDSGNNVSIAMTSHFGEKGMYFAFDVTESVPIYVNLDRPSYMNSGIELYLAHPDAKNLYGNNMFEIDLMPTGDMTFKRSNGKYAYANVATTNDKMAYLGATTKGGQVNTTECYGYVMELYIPWDYLKWLGVDTEAMQNGFVYINPAHITSNNYSGRDTSLDRYWYDFVRQQGAAFTEVTRYFRFDSNGAIGTIPIHMEQGEHYSVSGHASAMYGMSASVTVTPEAGYGVTSLLVDGQERIQDASYNPDGSVTLVISRVEKELTVSASVEQASAGNKTLSGRVVLRNQQPDILEGLILTCNGPTGEFALELDANGNFSVPELPAGYYEIKASKPGYLTIQRGIYLFRDFELELNLDYDLFFYNMKATNWSLENQNLGILQKLPGEAHILTNDALNDFTFEATLKYDAELAAAGTDDYHTQQRMGMQIVFSDGKIWYIHLLNDKGLYYLQYAAFGDNSLFQWSIPHKLTEAEIALYTSEEGLKLKVERQGRYAAISLDGKELYVETLPASYEELTAQVGLDAWIANTEPMEVLFSLSSMASVEEPPKAIFKHADNWDVSAQGEGILYKTGVVGDTTWLDSAVISKDITTVAKDLSPATKDYSMIYIFRFSNGEQFRVRLNHTDDDGRYRIQSVGGSTLFAAWKNHYTLTDAQEKKVQGEGISFRVLIAGCKAYVFLDDAQVCTYDLSTVVETGLPSGIDQVTCEVSLRLDGNVGKVTEIPFTLVELDPNKPDPEAPEGAETPQEPETPVDPNAPDVTLIIPALDNGTVTAGMNSYKVGQTVVLTVTPVAGYTQKLYLNGEPMMLDFNSNSCSFVATQESYEITGSFVEAITATAKDEERWDSGNQAHGVLNTYYPNNADSWWMDIQGEYRSMEVIAKNYLPLADTLDKFNTVLRVTLDNGNTYSFRFFADKNGSYAYCRFGIQNTGDASADWSGWKSLPQFDTAAGTDGVSFKVERTNANTLTIYVGGEVVDTYIMQGITADNKVVSMGVAHYGNQGQRIGIPFEMVEGGEFSDPEQPEEPEIPVDPDAKDVTLTIPAFENGAVTADKESYKVGQTVVLTVTPAEGYAQKLTINGETLLLDFRTNSYTFVATEETYTIAGSFEKALSMTAKDEGRWDTSNQAHGILSTYYPNNGDSWWMDINGDYKSIEVVAKNYLPLQSTLDKYNTVLRVTMDNGNVYAFRFYADKNGSYAYCRFGIQNAGDASADWSNWKGLPQYDEIAGMDGVSFKLERTAGDTLTLYVNGEVVDTYIMQGVTADNKVVSMGLAQHGNQGMNVEIPYVLVPQE